MISYDEALEMVLARSKPLGAETVAVSKSLGRVLASEVLANISLPRFDNSAVDGYALSDSEAESFVIRRIVAAGDPAGNELQPGECARIFTGAPVPLGTKCVVMQEDVEVRGNEIFVREVVSQGANIRRTGEDLEMGEVALPAGLRLSSAGVGVLAMLGLTTVEVFRMPKVGILVTGSELSRSGETLGESEIYESNSVALHAALQEVGIEDILTEVVSDETDSTEVAIRRMLNDCDVLLTTGGVSVGDRDVVRTVFERLGVQQVFWKVAMKPGKPVYFGALGDKLIFGLPGNPQSALTTFCLLALPAIRSVMGGTTAGPIRLRARLMADMKHKPDRREFVPANLEIVEGEMRVCPVGQRMSHMLTGLAKSQVWIDFPADLDFLSSGSSVEVIPFGGGLN